MTYHYSKARYFGSRYSDSRCDTAAVGRVAAECLTTSAVASWIASRQTRSLGLLSRPSLDSQSASFVVTSTTIELITYIVR